MVSMNKRCLDSATGSTMLFTHCANSRPISTFTTLFFMLTPTAWNVSKFSWFPSLSSWRRRNFLGKRFTFLATRELLVQLKPGCFALPQPPLYMLLLTNNLLPGSGGRIGSVDCLPRWKVFAELAQSFTANGHVLNAHVEFLTKGRKVSFPLPGPQNVRKARLLCGWIGGLRLWRDPTSWSNKWGMETVLWHREDPVKISTLGTVSLNSYFSLVLALLISHLSLSGISCAVCASSNTETDI